MVDHGEIDRRAQNFRINGIKYHCWRRQGAHGATCDETGDLHFDVLIAGASVARTSCQMVAGYCRKGGNLVVIRFGLSSVRHEPGGNGHREHDHHKPTRKLKPHG